MVRWVAIVTSAMLFTAACAGSNPAETGDDASTTIAATADTTSTSVADTNPTDTRTTPTSEAVPEQVDATTTSIAATGADGRPAPRHPVGSALAPGPPTMIEPIGDQRQDILYQPGVRLSLFEPSGECGVTRRPTIVTGGPSSNVFVDWFRRNGYNVADVAWRSPGYTGGLSTGTLEAFTHSVNDLGVAVQWLRAHAEELCVDTERIAAVGYSFGAITSLSLAYSSEELREGGDIAIDELGGSATLPSQVPMPPPELASYSNEIKAVVSFAGFAIADTIEAGEPPALLIHGRGDATIPFALAEQTCAAASDVGVTCELIAHDSGHGMADDVPEALASADDFLRRELQIETPAGP